MRADFAQDEQFVSWFYQRYHNGKKHKGDLFGQRKPKYKTKRQLRIETRDLGLLHTIKEEKE
jgi:hypothetical protein